MEACDTITACFCGICTHALIIFRIRSHRILSSYSPFYFLVQAIDITRHLTSLKLKNFSGNVNFDVGTL